jgi:type IV pilus assembly protein PilC
VKDQKKQKNKNKKPISFASSFGLKKEKAFLLRNIAFLISSGMDMLKVLRSIKSEIRNKAMLKVIADIETKIDNGYALWRALDSTGIFPDHAVSLIKIGEETGRLKEILNIIVIREQKEQEFRSKIISALSYPGFIFTLTMVIGIGITVFILPRLAEVYEKLNIKLPLITKIFINVGLFVKQNGIYVIPLFVLSIVLIIFFVFFYKKTKFIGQFLILRTPKLNELIKQVEIARFGFVLSTLLEAGIPIIFALDSLSQTTDLFAYKKFYRYLKNTIEEGNSFEKSFVAYKGANRLLPFSVQQLVIIGEQSRTLPEVLVKIAEDNEKKNAESLKNFASAIEPIMLIFVWIGVAIIALAVVLPIYSLVGDIGGDPTQKQQSQSTTSPVSNNSIEETPTPTPTEIPTPTPTVELTPIATTIPTEIVYPTLIINGVPASQKLKIRDKPSGKIISETSNGAEYKYTSTQAGWYEIIYNTDGAKGWVSGSYVKLQN